MAADAFAGTVFDGQPMALLRALGLVDAGGRASADAARKIKQIEHFVRLLRPAIDEVLARHADPVFVDFGAGKAYLGLLVHHLLLQPAGRGTTIAVEARPDLADRVRRIVAEHEIPRFEVLDARILDAELPSRIHFALALHACDTATDEALVRALVHRADHIAVVPCCQAEVGRLLQGTTTPPMDSLWRHAWHRREFGAHLTNVMRALVLEANGYQTTVTELAGWEHSLKNELILGRRVARQNAAATTRLDALFAGVGVTPWLLQQPVHAWNAPAVGEEETPAAPDPE